MSNSKYNTANTIFLYFPAVPNIIKNVKKFFFCDSDFTLYWSNTQPIPQYRSIILTKNPYEIISTNSKYAEDFIKSWKYDDFISPETFLMALYEQHSSQLKDIQSPTSN